MKALSFLIFMLFTASTNGSLIRRDLKVVKLRLDQNVLQQSNWTGNDKQTPTGPQDEDGSKEFQEGQGLEKRGLSDVFCFRNSRKSKHKQTKINIAQTRADLIALRESLEEKPRGTRSQLESTESLNQPKDVYLTATMTRMTPPRYSQDSRSPPLAGSPNTGRPLYY